MTQTAYLFTKRTVAQNT